MPNLVRQHLIDPEICIRCETCAEMCQQDAISYDGVNVVVDYSVCTYSMDCIAPCPTGAIDSWVMVESPYSVAEQFGWDELPAGSAGDKEDVEIAEAVDNEVSDMLKAAHAGLGGETRRPGTSSQPCVNLYSRSAPVVAQVQGNFRITDPAAGSDVRHIILDLGTNALPVLEGQSLGVVPPGQDARGRKHHMRLYSLCSPRDGERPNHNNIAFTVKRVVEQRDGVTFKGVASNYMCDLKKGDKVELTGPYGSTFLMPNNLEANIMMICTGTGSAPFRAMTERRRRTTPGAPGELILFFGARTPGELPYFGPLTKLPDSLIRRELVFSREPGKPKEYVQDRIRKCADRVAALLTKDQTYIYICGLKGMEQGVEDAFAAVCSEHGLDWAQIRSTMRAEGRLHIETY